MIDHKIAFIAGLHRSGTSLLFQCLRENPHISGLRGTGVPKNEGQHLQTVYPPARAHGGPGRFGFDPEAHLTECSSRVSEDNRCLLFAEWSRYWDLSRPVLLEKSPPNLIRTRFLQALFPESHFIVVLRHPVAVSYATQEWSRTPLDRLIEHWLVCYERFEADRNHLKHLLVIRYENLVGAPQATLDQIHAFLGVESHRIQLKVRPDVNATYLNTWLHSQDRFSSSALDRVAIRKRYRERVARFGYDLDATKKV